MLDVQNRNNPKPFILPFVASDNGWMNEFLKIICISKEALGTLFGVGHNGMKALVQHAVHHTLPIHQLTGRVLKVTTKFQQNVVTLFAYFFKNRILPIAGARPNRYTSCAVTQTVTERDTNDIMELDPGVSKTGLFKECAYINGYKIKTIAKGNIIKVPDDNNKYNQIEICSWEYVEFTIIHVLLLYLIIRW